MATEAHSQRSPFAARQLAEVRRVVLHALGGQHVALTLFGSRARGDASRVSDVDLALRSRDGLPLPGQLLRAIREALENSDVVYSVDVVDLATVEDALRARIDAEGIDWTA